MIKKQGAISKKRKKERREELYSDLEELRKTYRLTKGDFEKDISPMQHHYKAHIHSFVAQNLVESLWKSYKKLFYGNGKHIHYKKFDTLNSLESKNNKTGITYQNGEITWTGLSIPVKINPKNDYETEALKNEVAYCRIVRKFIKGRFNTIST